MRHAEMLRGDDELARIEQGHIRRRREQVKRERQPARDQRRQAVGFLENLRRRVHRPNTPSWTTRRAASTAMAADIFDALTADRPYRAAMPVTKALAIMSEMVDTAIDRRCYDALCRAMDRLERQKAA